MVIADLHAEAVERTAARLRALARVRARCPEMGARVRSPQRRRIAQRANAEREPKAAAGARGEGSDRHVGIPARDRVGQR